MGSGFPVDVPLNQSNGCYMKFWEATCHDAGQVKTIARDHREHHAQPSP